ncbi:unnamed protein product [Pylaiella littoralis]
MGFQIVNGRQDAVHSKPRFLSYFDTPRNQLKLLRLLQLHSSRSMLRSSRSIPLLLEATATKTLGYTGGQTDTL